MIPRSAPFHYPVSRSIILYMIFLPVYTFIVWWVNIEVPITELKTPPNAPIATKSGMNLSKYELF